MARWQVSPGSRSGLAAARFRIRFSAAAAEGPYLYRLKPNTPGLRRGRRTAERPEVIRNQCVDSAFVELPISLQDPRCQCSPASAYDVGRGVAEPLKTGRWWPGGNLPITGPQFQRFAEPGGWSSAASLWRPVSDFVQAPLEPAARPGPCFCPSRRIISTPSGLRVVLTGRAHPFEQGGSGRHVLHPVGRPRSGRLRSPPPFAIGNSSRVAACRGQSEASLAVQRPSLKTQRGDPSACRQPGSQGPGAAARWRGPDRPPASAGPSRWPRAFASATGGASCGHQHLVGPPCLLPAAQPAEVVIAAADTFPAGGGPAPDLGRIVPPTTPTGCRFGPFRCPGHRGIEIGHALTARALGQRAA